MTDTTQAAARREAAEQWLFEAVGVRRAHKAYSDAECDWHNAAKNEGDRFVEAFEAGWDGHASWAQSQANPNAPAETRSSVEKCDNELLADELVRCLKRYGIDCLGPYGQDVVWKVVAALRAQSAAPVPLTPVTDEIVDAAELAYSRGPKDNVSHHRENLRRAIEAAFIASRGKGNQK